MRTTRTIACFGALTLCAFAGCRTATVPQAPRGVSPAALHHYLDARAAWVAMQSEPVTSVALRRRREHDVIVSLERAAAVEPDVPLFPSRIAALRLGQQAFDPLEVERLARTALATTVDWVPGHLQLAELAAVRGDRLAAEEHLGAAKRALARTLEGIPGEWQGIEVLGIRLFGPSPPDLLDPGLEPAEGYVALLQWLHEDLGWRIDDPSLSSAGAGDGAAVGTLGSAAQHLKARIAWTRFRVGARLGAAPLELAECLELAHRLDARWFEPELYRGILAIGAGRFREAESILLPYWTVHSPMLLANTPLRDALLHLYARWVVRGDDPAAERRAREFCADLEQVYGELEDPFLGAVQGGLLASAPGRGSEQRDAALRLDEAAAALGRTAEAEVLRGLARRCRTAPDRSVEEPR